MKDFKFQFGQSVFRFFTLGAVAGMLSLAPRPMPAQATDATAVQSTLEGQPADASKEPALSAEEKQNQAFRLEGPVVKWTAKTFNLTIETAATLFEVANFLIIVLAIGVPLLRFLPGYLRRRKQKLSDDLESARKQTEDANARLKAVEDKLSKLGEEIEKFRAQTETESRQDEARIQASFAEESRRIVESAEQEINVAAAQARRGLRSFAADLAIDQAAKELVLTPAADRVLIAEFVGEVIGNGGAAGGRK